MKANVAAAFAQDRAVILWLIVLGIAARMAMLVAIDPIPSLLAGDADYYWRVATSLAEDGRHWLGGAPTAYRPPLYPAFLALLQLVGGGPVQILFVQAAIGVATGVATFVLLKHHHRALAIAAAALIVTSPFLIVYENKLIAEALYIPLLWTGWLLLFTSFAPRLASRAVAAGVLTGLAILTRETFILLPIAAFFFLFICRDRRTVARRLLVAAAIAFLVLVPWTVRNATLATERVATTEGRFGFNLWVGTWERDGDWVLPGVAKANFPDYAFRNPAERQRLIAALRDGNDAAFGQVALDRISSDPAAVATTWVQRYPQLWLGTRTEQIDLRPARESLAWKALKAGFYGLNLLVIAVGFAGAIWSVARRNRWAFFAVPLAYFAAIHIPFHNVETRYSLVALPFLYLFVAILLVGMLRRIRSIESTPSAL